MLSDWEEKMAAAQAYNAKHNQGYVPPTQQTTRASNSQYAMDRRA